MKRERILTTFLQVVYVAAARTVSMALHGIGIAPASGRQRPGRPVAARAAGLEAMTYNAPITAISAVRCARGCGGIGRRASFRY